MTWVRWGVLLAMACASGYALSRYSLRNLAKELNKRGTRVDRPLPTRATPVVPCQRQNRGFRDHG